MPIRQGRRSVARVDRLVLDRVTVVSLTLATTAATWVARRRPAPRG
jgi:hypothetical protein